MRRPPPPTSVRAAADEEHRPRRDSRPTTTCAAPASARVRSGRPSTTRSRSSSSRQEPRTQRNINVQMFSGQNRFPAGPFEDMPGNPVMSLFLEHHLRISAARARGESALSQERDPQGPARRATVTPTKVAYTAARSTAGGSRPSPSRATSWPSACAAWRT